MSNNLAKSVQPLCLPVWHPHVKPTKGNQLSNVRARYPGHESPMQAMYTNERVTNPSVVAQSGLVPVIPRIFRHYSWGLLETEGVDICFVA